MAEHELKCDPAPFDAVWEGRKTHEIRLDDREGGFKVGDRLRLRKTSDDGAFYNRTGERPVYTGAELRVFIKHVQKGYGLLPGWAILSLLIEGRLSTGRTGMTRFILPGDYE